MGHVDALSRLHPEIDKGNVNTEVEFITEDSLCTEVAACMEDEVCDRIQVAQARDVLIDSLKEKLEIGGRRV